MWGGGVHFQSTPSVPFIPSFISPDTLPAYNFTRSSRPVELQRWLALCLLIHWTSDLHARSALADLGTCASYVALVLPA